MTTPRHAEAAENRGTTALGSGFRYVHPQALGGRAHLAAGRCPAHPCAGLGQINKQRARRGEEGRRERGGLAPAAAPSRGSGARSASPGRRSHFEPLRISGSGRGAPGTAMAGPRPPWRVTSDAPGPAVELEGVVHHAGHQAHGAGGLGGGGTHGEQQQQRRSRQTYLGACVRASAPGLLLLLPLLQPGM